MNSNKFVKCIICLVLILSIIFVGCSKVDSNNMAAIEYVLTNMLTCPDEILIDYYNKAIDEVPTKNESGVYNIEDTVSGKKFLEYLDEKYGKYIDESVFDNIIGLNVINLSVTSQLSGYKINVVNVNIKKEEKIIGTDYLFEVELNYITDENIEKTTTIKGTARCKNEGKVSYISGQSFYTLLNEMKDKIDDKNN